jgi:hypothetical protein
MFSKYDQPAVYSYNRKPLACDPLVKCQSKRLRNENAARTTVNLRRRDMWRAKCDAATLTLNSTGSRLDGAFKSKPLGTTSLMSNSKPFTTK